MKVRDLRTKRYFTVHNIIVDTYGKELGPIGLATYMALCRMADKDDQTCYPSYKTLADRIGAGRASVGKALAQLKALELVDWEQRPGSGDNLLSNLYVLLEPPKREVVHQVDYPSPGGGLGVVQEMDSNNPNMNNPQLSSLREDAQVTKGDYFTVTEELEYTDPDEDVSSPRRGPVASTPEQQRWLAATGAESFKPGHKSRVKSILASVKRGEALGALKGDAAVYQQCLKELGSINAAGLKSPPSILPRSWLENRYENARKYTWTRDNLVDNTLKRESLVDHCRTMLKKAGGSAAEESVSEYAARRGLHVYE